MITTRALTPSDSKAAARIHGGSFEPGWDADTLRTHIANDLTLGLFDGGALRGFAVLRRAADQADIVTIAVDPALRGAGLGRRLLNDAEVAARAAGVTLIFLEVAVDNVAATALYKQAGYVPIGTRPAYYKRAQGRVAAVTFRKDLT